MCGLANGEALLTFRAGGYEIRIILWLNHSGLYELAHQYASTLVPFGLGLQLHHLDLILVLILLRLLPELLDLGFHPV